MALISCSECGKQVSDKASSCPNCGNPINEKPKILTNTQPTTQNASSESVMHCPKCDSTQLSTNKKGFSGGKALTGAVLTGGIGLLAGTHGSNKVKITCLACGKEFKPGEGKTIIKPIHSANNLTTENTTTEKYDEIDYQIIHLVKAKGKLAATIYCKDSKSLGLKEAKDYVENLAFKNGLGPKPTQSEGCFIATACYGNYNAPEVVVLRKYRDQVLHQTNTGRIVINFYYAVSPAISKLISQSEYLKKFIKHNLLKPLIYRIENKNTKH